MEQTNDDEEDKPIPRQSASLDILREQIEEEGKAAEERIFEGVNRALEEKGPYIAEFHRASTTDEILEIYDRMLKDNDYLENVDMRNLTRELKMIKTLNDNILKTDIWKSKDIFNMYKLVKLYANIRTPEDLQERFNRFIAVYSPTHRHYRWRGRHFFTTCRELFMKYSKNFKTNNPDIWTRETAQKFGQLWRKIKEEGAGGRTKKKCKRKSRRRKSRRRKSRRRKSRRRKS